MRITKPLIEDIPQDYWELKLFEAAAFRARLMIESILKETNDECQKCSDENREKGMLIWMS